MIKMQDIIELSVAERILMVEKIWDSIDPESIPVPFTYDLELDRRLNRYENGETTFVSWDSIKNELGGTR
jgi:putative addiction module component (TIGR02574 family)